MTRACNGGISAAMRAFTEADLLSIAEAYAGHLGLSMATISKRVFNDGKLIGSIRAGNTITLRRANAAMQWFTDNWPENLDWPAHIARPDRSAAAEASEAAE